MHDRDHRLRLLAAVIERLKGTGVPYALIGAGAMAVHGVARSTADADVLVTDTECLRAAHWAGLPVERVKVEVRRGDDDDPLAGVVRFRAASQQSVDLVVGKFAWQTRLIRRAEVVSSQVFTGPVLRAADLILLKLFAGGPQDAWDIHQLLAAGDRGLIEEVSRDIELLPGSAAALWEKILSELPA